MGGLIGGIADGIFGRVDPPKKSGAYDDTAKLGKALSNQIFDLFKGRDSEFFLRNSAVIADLMKNQVNASGQRFSDFDTSRGFNASQSVTDSATGALQTRERLAGIEGLQRTSDTAGTLSDTSLLDSQDRRVEGLASNFLAIGANENTAIETLNLSGALQQRGQNIQHMKNLIEMFSIGGFGGGGGGGGGGDSAGASFQQGFDEVLKTITDLGDSSQYSIYSPFGG